MHGNTIRYLTLRQIIFQIFRRLKKITYVKKIANKNLVFLKNVDPIQFSYLKIDQKRSVLNLFGHSYCNLDLTEKYFNGNDYLFDYSFHYLEFINSREFTSEFKFNLFETYYKKHAEFGNFRFMPYTTSKRLISLIILHQQNYNLFNDYQSKTLEEQICNEAYHLRKNIEYNIGANHLLTNFMALSCYFLVSQDEKFKVFQDYYDAEFRSQFKNFDHVERSFSYGKLMVYERLIYLNFSSQNKRNQDQELLIKVLENLRFKSASGCVSFGDNIDEQAPILKELIEYFNVLFEDVYEPKPLIGTKKFTQTLDGYALYNGNKFKSSVDIGEPSPSYQPGHAHDSTGAMVLSYDGHELFSSGGVSTYEKGPTRELERSRFSYSKVTSVGPSQQVWSSFRVARRRHVKHFKITDNQLSFKLEGNWDHCERNILICDDNELVIIKDCNKGCSTEWVGQFLISGDWEFERVDAHLIRLRNLLERTLIMKLESNATFDITSVELGVRYAQTKKVNIIRMVCGDDVMETRLAVAR